MAPKLQHFSLLDLSPIPEGGTAADALGNTIDLARNTEASGYHRYWLAEQFGTLATLYPGRIDLGLGRAPGTDGESSSKMAENAVKRRNSLLIDCYQGNHRKPHRVN